MATQMLIYETAVPVTQARHAQWSVEAGGDYAFCRNVNSVPKRVSEQGSMRWVRAQRQKSL